MGTTTLRPSSGSKELASVVADVPAEGLLRDQSPVGDRAPGPGLGGWPDASRDGEVLDLHLRVFLPAETLNPASMGLCHGGSGPVHRGLLLLLHLWVWPSDLG